MHQRRALAEFRPEQAYGGTLFWPHARPGFSAGAAQWPLCHRKPRQTQRKARRPHRFHPRRSGGAPRSPAGTPPQARPAPRTPRQAICPHRARRTVGDPLQPDRSASCGAYPPGLAPQGADLAESLPEHEQRCPARLPP